MKRKAKVVFARGKRADPKAPLSMTEARAQVAKANTRAKAVRALRDSGIVTSRGNLRERFK